MDNYMATEVAYKNGYARGYEDGKKHTNKERRTVGMICRNCEHFEKSRLYSFGFCKVKNYERHEADDVCCDIQSVRFGQDTLIVGYDCNLPDMPTLCIARNKGNKVNVLKVIQGDEAFDVYHYLTGDWKEE